MCAGLLRTPTKGLITQPAWNRSTTELSRMNFGGKWYGINTALRMVRKQLTELEALCTDVTLFFGQFSFL